eukprot:Seg2138.2 transcript_id=Seg2138.2/GoldUCD/mRNA.D3Y31 product="Melatonin-related receptor" protein_id=Seg2138.2/GoldUCD/D3Y31
MQNNATEKSLSLLHSESISHRMTEMTLMLLIFIVGAIGNPVTAYLVFSNKRLHNIQNCLTINIIAIDLIATFTIVPIQIITLALGKWPFGEAMCQMTGLVTVVLSVCSLWTIVWLSILRIILMTRPGLYATLVLPKYMIPILLSTWGVSIFGGSFVFAIGTYAFKAKFVVCFFLFESVPTMIAYMVPLVLMPVMLVSGLSILIAIKLNRKRRYNPQQQDRREEKEIALTYLMLVLVYVACYLPVFIVEAEEILFKGMVLSHDAYMIVTYFGYLPFSLKTMAYGLTKKSFRKEIKSWFIPPRKIYPTPDGKETSKRQDMVVSSKQLDSHEVVAIKPKEESSV